MYETAALILNIYGNIWILKFKHKFENKFDNKWENWWAGLTRSATDQAKYRERWKQNEIIKALGLVHRGWTQYSLNSGKPPELNVNK